MRGVIFSYDIRDDNYKLVFAFGECLAVSCVCLFIKFFLDGAALLTIDIMSSTFHKLHSCIDVP